MTDRCNSIRKDLMEMLQMLKFSIKSGKSLDFSKGTSREDVLAYLEDTLEALNAIPEDINAFIHSLQADVR